MAGEILIQPIDEYLADRSRLSNSMSERWIEDHQEYVDIMNGKPWGPPSDEMKFGLYFEALLFGDPEVKARYVVAPSRPDDPTKVLHRGKKEYKEFAKGVAGRTIILPDQALRAPRMAEAVAAHPVAHKLIARGRGEDQVVIHWTCPVSGLDMKGRPDRVLRLPRAPFDVIIDLKTDRDPRDTHERVRRWHERGYHRKMAGYLDGWYEATGRNAKGFIVAVSNQGPVRCCVYSYEAGKPAIETGRVEYLKAAKEIAEARATGFYGYPEEREAVEGTVPHWATFDASSEDMEAA